MVRAVDADNRAVRCSNLASCSTTALAGTAGTSHSLSSAETIYVNALTIGPRVMSTSHCFNWASRKHSDWVRPVCTRADSWAHLSANEGNRCRSAAVRTTVTEIYRS